MQIIGTCQAADDGGLPLVTVAVALDAWDSALMITDPLSHLDPKVHGRTKTKTIISLRLRCTGPIEAINYTRGRFQARRMPGPLDVA